MLRAVPGEVFWPVFGIGAIISFMVAGIILVRVVPARLMERLKSRGIDPMLDELNARLGEIEQLNQRINELEERVDFTERLLATRPEKPRLEPPG